MKVHFSKNISDKNIMKIKPETDFERDVLLGFGSEGKWEIFPDRDANLVIKEQDFED